tara:strand:+ start:42 stop:368 length:327 start_codon:yes stop_codon:yes gene_type:complete
MTKYAATFAEHTITRKSDREYSHAWIVTTDAGICDRGFSGSVELAHKAAASVMPRFISDKDKATCRRTHKLLAKDLGLSLSQWYTARDDYVRAQIAARTTEVVAVERS